MRMVYADREKCLHDRDYVINAINYMFPELGIKAEDVESSWDRN